jgi:hypothetical protein
VNWNAYLSNPLLANPRVKKWVETLMEHRSMLGHAAGGKLGELLGCGHWGCVIDMPGTPWVLKLTVDPTEAHVWSKILELMEDERYGEDGFPRFKKLFRLEPGVPYGRQGRRRVAYGIVREKIAPVFSWEAKWRDLYLTDASKRILGLSELMQPVPGRSWNEVNYVPRSIGYREIKSIDIPKTSEHKVEEFVQNIEAIKRYREHAWEYHRKGNSFGIGTSRDRALRLCEQAANRMGGPIGGPLGESLIMLASNNVILNDVHELNLGWRVLPEVEGVEGYNCLVIFDPGHTPTQKRQLPEERWVQLAALG